MGSHLGVVSHPSLLTARTVGEFSSCNWKVNCRSFVHLVFDMVLDGYRHRQHSFLQIGWSNRETPEAFVAILNHSLWTWLSHGSPAPGDHVWGLGETTGVASSWVCFSRLKTPPTVDKVNIG